MGSQNSTILGVVLLTRHGDRQGFYQSPDTHTAAQTAITPLGLVRAHTALRLLHEMHISL